ncbi:NAD(P)/FAD-dependent oxidoreductase [Candidatus Entotheonella palauensis]|uniref:NAD(P)/FAD-dependent oxidoreductase n=1 Tax=Candidatus Entotheonella palauensis TaxID=93172 RepID=UPI000B7DD698|nr:FAD-dependent oxidoreductase [Candidatus Entotheonella palauensis]
MTVFERDRRCGGHAHTILLDEGPDAGTPLDIGFMVLNDRNYPTLHQLLRTLGDIDLGDSEMSFGYYSEPDGLHYALNWNGSNTFAQETNLQGASTSSGQPRANPHLLDLFMDIMRFCRQVRGDLQEGRLEGLTLGDYLAAQSFPKTFIDRYLLPMGAAIWSTPPGEMLAFPAQAFARFFEQHGLLSLRDVPQWQYIHGGSQRYVERLVKCFRGQVECARPVEAVARQDEHVVVTAAGESHAFDAVVVAAHADEALRLLADPSEDERRLLGAWRYQKNHAVLHTDTGVMPPDLTSWASWNYTREAQADASATLCVTYHLNRLQHHLNTVRPYFLTLNRQRAIASEHVLGEFTLTHPTYTFDALASQADLTCLNGTRRTFFCGSYLGYGFHEDAVQSGVAVAQLLGCSW